MDNRTSMIRLIVFGNIPERSLKELAYQIGDDLASLPAVSQVETTGTREYEISIEVPLVHLRAFGLTLDDVANAVRRSSLDLSAGSIDRRDAQVRIRTIGQKYDQLDFEEIVVIARKDGTVVRLGDTADVRDAFRDSDLILRHQGQPALFVEVYRAEGKQVMDVARAVQEHIANVIVPSLPEGVGVTIWNDDSQTFSERADILRRNGLMGLVLVFVALALFLEIRLALWVVSGLTTAGVGALAGVVGLLVVSLSQVPAGIVPTTFAPVVEGDFVTANLEIPDGTPAKRTYEVAMELERAIQAQFLVPFAASLGVGIMVTTGILILLVPALMAVYLRANSDRGAATAKWLCSASFQRADA